MSFKKLIFEVREGGGVIRAWQKGNDRFLTVAHAGERSYKKAKLTAGQPVKINRVDANGQVVSTTTFVRKGGK